ncbi:MAG TPA: hypothetical protein VF897_19490, partial [Roseiflexaceae bacterium]
MSGRSPETLPGWWSRLFGAGAQNEAARTIERMERQLADLRGEVAALRAALAEGTWGAQPDLAALREGLLGLEKQVGRAGREQLKVNSIAEAQSGQLAAALEQMRAADARREAELAALRERSRGAQATARMEVVQNILPALDGLDEALR